MGQKLSIPESEVTRLKQKIKLSREDAEQQRSVRKKNHDAYYRLPLGNEKPGRSKVIDTAVYNHVSGVYPHLLRQFSASDLKIAIRGQDKSIANALKQRIRSDIFIQGGHTLVDDTIKDGLISHNGTAKMWWSRVWGEPIQRQVMVTEKQLIAMSADPRFEFSEQDITPQQPMYGEINDGIPTPEAPMGTVMSVEGAPMFAVAVTFRNLSESGPVILSVPPEEVLFERGKARINDRCGVGHVRKMTAGEIQRDQDRKSTPTEKYYDNLNVAIESNTSGGLLSREEEERRERNNLSWTDSLTMPGELLLKECEIIEWCDWVSANDKLVPAFAIFINDELVRCEQNEEDIIPYSTWSPITTPHCIVGQSIASLHVDTQNINTMLTRAILDNIAMTVDKPRWVKNRGTDMLGLQNISAGKLLFGNPDDVQEVDTAPLDYRILQVLEYLKAQGEERGPTTRFNQGTEAGPGGNNTATGIGIVTRASFNKIEAISYAYSELFLVDLYNKLIHLYQANLDLPVTEQVDGEEVTLTRENIQGNYTAHSDLGASLDFDDREFQQSSAMLAMVSNLIKTGIYPVSPQSVREFFKNVLVASGLKDVNKYLEIAPSPNVPQGAIGGQGAGQIAPNATPGDQTLDGGTANPEAGMGPGQ